MSGDYEKDLSPSRAAQEADATPGKEQEEAQSRADGTEVGA